jgi:RHS repeat-associated protein
MTQTNRTLSGTGWTLAYDYEGQLTSTATGGNTISSFAYDALGRRYSRTNGGTTTVFYYGPGGILAEKQGGSFTSAYAYGNGLIRKDDEYPMFDGLGSERTVTNSSQTVTGTITFEGFGGTIATTGSSSNSYTFAATSRYRDDSDAALVQVGARYYDAQVGRFITRDTELDQKPFLYCEHDPVNHVDPTGHWIPWWPFGHGGGHKGGGGGGHEGGGGERKDVDPVVKNFGEDVGIAGGIIAFIPGGAPIGGGLVAAGGLIMWMGKYGNPFYRSDMPEPMLY